MSSRLRRKANRVARNRESFYLEAQNSVINEERRALKDNNKKRSNKKNFRAPKELLNSLSRTKPKNFKTLYYKTLSRNHILDISDESCSSPINLCDGFLNTIKDPEFEPINLTQVQKCLHNMKSNQGVIRRTLNQIKSITTRDNDVTVAISIVKFILKMHLDQDYLFESNVIKSYSECDYVVKFWSPLLEILFKKSGIIPHWGDTKLPMLTSLGIHMKMDLRLIAVPANKFISDNGFGEFSNIVSELKYYKDKRKAVIASKALLNTILKKTKTSNYQDIYVPYIIVMGFEMHLCFLILESKKLYMTKKLKTLFFPTTLDDFSEVTNELVNGLLNLLEMCLRIKKVFNKGTKRKSMDTIIGASPNKTKNNDCISKVIWDDVDEDSMTEYASDLDDSSSASTNDSSDDDIEGDNTDDDVEDDNTDEDVEDDEADEAEE